MYRPEKGHLLPKMQIVPEGTSHTGSNTLKDFRNGAFFQREFPLSIETDNLILRDRAIVWMVAKSKQ